MNSSCQKFCAQRSSVTVRCGGRCARVAARFFQNARHCSPIAVHSVRHAAHSEQTTSTFFASRRSRRQFLAAQRESATAHYRLASNIRESTWGFYEVGNAFSRSVPSFRESARAFRRSARPHRRWTGIFRLSAASLRRLAATHRPSPGARSQSEATHFDNDSSVGDNPDPFVPIPFPSHSKANPDVILSEARGTRA